MTSLPPNKAIRLDWASISEIGMRSSNQDHIGLAEQDDMSCFAVADGAGGHQGGEIASRAVVDALLAKFGAESAFGTRALRCYLEHASRQLVLTRQGKPELADMSTTVAALLLDRVNARAVWAHLGDTRIYLFRGARLHAVTRDHSLTQQLIDAGYARADQLRTHPQRNILFAAVGTEGDSAPSITELPVDLLEDDALLICTDGLWEWVHEDQMEQTLAAAQNSQDWLSAMCAIAGDAAQLSGKTRDNYSAYAIRVRQPELQT
jgi:serine/threonine protein phosphatase PrpC